MCPLAQKAIELDDVTVTNGEGLEVVVRRPVVIRDRCIGCGLCENRCPVKGEAAIRVYPDDGEGEHRRRGRS
jgi:NAD-dependent dihydropyrimidine dehydrogenase PreA subunit